MCLQNSVLVLCVFCMPTEQMWTQNVTNNMVCTLVNKSSMAFSFSFLFFSSKESNGVFWVEEDQSVFVSVHVGFSFLKFWPFKNSAFCWTWGRCGEVAFCNYIFKHQWCQTICVNSAVLPKWMLQFLIQLFCWQTLLLLWMLIICCVVSPPGVL